MFIFAQTFAPKNLFCFNWFRVSAPVDEDSTLPDGLASTFKPA